MAGDGEPIAGGSSSVSANTVSADFRTDHTAGIHRDARGAEDADLSGAGRPRKACGTADTTGWEHEREILFGLIQEALRRSAGPEQRKGTHGANLPKMGAHHGSGIGSVFDASLRAVSAFGRLTESADEDEEERRRRIEAEQNSRAVGTVLGLAVGALLAIRDEEERRKEAAMQEEYENEQQNIWQLSM